MNNPENRRSFFKKASVLLGAFSVNSLFHQLHAATWKETFQSFEGWTPQELASNEDYWSVIQQGYSASSSPVIILNNGGVSPSPIVVQQAVERFNQMTNQGPSYYMWQILDQGRESLREGLAKLGGCSAEEIDINRNATEALVTVIYGLDLKKEKINKVWPLVCAGDPKSDNIRKFENLGTRSFPIEQGIGEALNFHNAIGPKRKEERIRFLKDYWANKAKEIPKVKIHTSLKPAYSCALAGVSIEGMIPVDLSSKLFSFYKIHTTAIALENIHCVRVSPHVYTKLSDLDRLVEALEKITSKV